MSEFPWFPPEEGGGDRASTPRAAGRTERANTCEGCAAVSHPRPLSQAAASMTWDRMQEALGAWPWDTLRSQEEEPLPSPPLPLLSVSVSLPTDSDPPSPEGAEAAFRPQLCTYVLGDLGQMNSPL